MKRIYLSGYIGYDLTSTMVKQWLDEANGEEVEIHLNTQGGIVTEGIAIYDLIDKYTGKKKLSHGWACCKHRFIYRNLHARR